MDQSTSRLIKHDFVPIRGQVVDRPNRFIVNVNINGVVEKAYCPVSGRIGGLTIDNLPCLLSGPHEKRSTRYTVEALGLESFDSPTFQWIGINQTQCNNVVEKLFQARLLADDFPEAAKGLRREVPLQDRRIDFLLAEKTWLEVKMPLLKIHAMKKDSVFEKTFPAKDPSPRLPAQMKALEDEIALGKRAILFVCFQYVNTKDSDLKTQMNENIFPDEALKHAISHGLEQYACVMKYTETSIELVSVSRFA